jgi:hypothetical protein
MQEHLFCALLDRKGLIWEISNFSVFQKEMETQEAVMVCTLVQTRPRPYNDAVFFWTTSSIQNAGAAFQSAEWPSAISGQSDKPHIEDRFLTRTAS